MCRWVVLLFRRHRGEPHRHEYAEWAKKVVADICSAFPWLEQQLDDTSKNAEG
jgi:hypothetical protein